MKISTRHQGGWAASFIIVGAVLVLGLVGGVYYLKQQSGSREDAPVAVTTPEGNKQDNKSEQENSSERTAPTQQRQSSSEEPQRSTAPAQPATPTHSSQLPETGPADTIGHLIAIVSLTIAVVSYIQSRRQSFSL